MNVFVATLLVLGLVAALAWLVRRGPLAHLANKGKVVAVETAIPLGDRRSLVIVSVEGRRLLVAFVKIAAAAAVMGAAARWLDVSLHDLWPSASVAARVSRVGLAIGGSMAVLALAAFVLRIEEFRQVMTRLIRRGQRGV